MFRFMTEPESIIAEIEDYSRHTGWEPSTICIRALNNSRWYKRMVKSRRYPAPQAEKLRQYMKDNPPPERGVDSVPCPPSGHESHDPQENEVSHV